MSDILAAIAVQMTCPECGTYLETFQQTIEIGTDGTAKVNKKATCSAHGYCSDTQTIKAAKVFGQDVEILPAD